MGPGGYKEVGDQLKGRRIIDQQELDEWQDEGDGGELGRLVFGRECQEQNGA